MLIHIHIYNAHVITFMLNGTLASALEPTYSKRTQIHVYYVCGVLLETCRENEYRGKKHRHSSYTGIRSHFVF